MADKDVFKDREKALEDTYFQRQEQELIARMRRRVALEQERHKLADAAHIDDAEVIEVLQDLGYTEDTLPLLYLMPVIDTAWANGKVDSRERKLIEDLAVAHGVSKGSAAFDRLTVLLAERPSEAEMETNLLAVKAILASLPADERAEAQKSLIANCTTLATVGRKLFGGQEIPKAERESIEHIIHELGLNV